VLSEIKLRREEFEEFKATELEIINRQKNEISIQMQSLDNKIIENQQIFLERNKVIEEIDLMRKDFEIFKKQEYDKIQEINLKAQQKLDENN
jgi:hypothetical protein